MTAQALSPASSGEGNDDAVLNNDLAEVTTDDEDFLDDEKPKKVKKKKKKVKGEETDGDGVIKKKKKKKKKQVEDDENAEISPYGGTAYTEPNTPSGTGTDEEAALDQAPMKIPVRRGSNFLDDVEVSDVESDDDATAKASGKRSNSTGTHDQQTHIKFMQAQKAKQKAEAAAAAAAPTTPTSGIGGYDLPPDSDSDRDSTPSRPRKPVRTRRGPNEARYKSSSLGALDKKKQQLVLRKKQSIRIPAGSRRDMTYMSSDDEDGGNDDASSSSHDSSLQEGQMTLGGGGGGRSSGDDIPSRPVRNRGSGQAKYRSTSVGVLEKNAIDRFGDRMSDDDARSADGGTSDEGELELEASGGPPRRPQRTRRSGQQRFRSNSAGVLEKNARDRFNARSRPPNDANFVKPRQRSVGAIKAKETAQRSMEESSLHQAQPNIRVALPRLRSVGALNARGSGSNSSRRSSRDRDPGSDASNPDDSPVQRKSQSERMLRTKGLGGNTANDDDDDDDDSSSDGSSESEGVVVDSAPLPKSFRPTRKWADSSTQQSDILPSVRRTSSQASSTNKKPAATDMIAPPPISSDSEENNEVWTETLKDDDKKKKKKTKVKKNKSSDTMESVDGEQKKKGKKKVEKPKKSSAPGLESGSYH